MSEQSEIIESLINSYIDSTNRVISALTPTFVYNSNDPNDHRTVVDSIKKNLEDCDEFLFSVAFITPSGLILLKQKLQELQDKGIKGKILTTNYLDFTDPKAIDDLIAMPNVEVRMHYLDDQNKIGFHTKGYIFRYGENYKAIIGSSNITDAALSISQEWNNEIVGTSDGAMIKKILEQFHKLWDNAKPAEDIIDRYREEFKEAKEKLRLAYSEDEKRAFVKPTPNFMQMAFVESLNASIERGDKRGLLISSTGTGKTYASAFAVRDTPALKVKRLLYVTHRETILEQASNSYRRVIGNEINMELYTGNNHEIVGDGFVFSTLNTIREKKYRDRFPPDYFDMVIIDEAHKISEEGTYLKDVIGYFKPKFLLGMTATPDRTDHYDIYGLFNNNILYEIRLRGALEAKMLCPFHYFGITDFTVDGKIVEKGNYSLLVADERVKHILERSKYFGYSGERLKGLIFVSSIEEGEELAKKISAEGYRARFICGRDSSEVRRQAINELENDDPFKPMLDFILTVDIFNEGVDIPSVNQIILLRPTESAIIFVQQLGRGLRLFENKDYLVVLDFIGNYENNYLIASAFTAKDAQGKGGAVKTTIAPSLVGPNTVEFDPIATKKVLESIERASFFQVRRLKAQYLDVKNRLGRVPTLVEFDKHGDLSGRAFLDFGGICYYDFLLRCEEAYIKSTPLPNEARKCLRYLSANIANGMRVSEAFMLRELMNGSNLPTLIKKAKDSRIPMTKRIVKSCIDILSGKFESAPYKNLFSCLEVHGNDVKLSKEFVELLDDEEFMKQIDWLLEYAFYSYEHYFKPGVDGNELFDEEMGFVYYKKYSRKAVCRLANLPNHSSTIFGYKIYKNPLFLPIFVTYAKALDEDSTVAYDDRFVNEHVFQWISKNKRDLKSPEIKDCIDAFNNGKALLFIKKVDIKNPTADDDDFYFVGQASIDPNNPPVEDLMANGQSKVVRFRLLIDKTVPYDVYTYLTSPLLDK